MQIEGIKDLIAKERAEADKTHPLFVDNHQAYAVILEELQETVDEVKNVERVLAAIWLAVKNDLPIRKVAEDGKDYAIRAIQEMIQVAAMCQKAIDSEVKRKEESCTK